MIRIGALLLFMSLAGWAQVSTGSIVGTVEDPTGLASDQLPGTYPRIYRTSGAWLIGLTLFGVLLSAGGIAGAWEFARQRARTAQSPLWLIVLFTAIAVFGIYCLLSIFRSRIALYPDRIEVVELTRTIVLGREEIRGWRTLPTSPPVIVLEPKDADRRKVKMTMMFREDAEFSEWVYSLPSLDHDEVRAEKVEIRNDERLGDTPGTRRQALAQWRRTAKRLTIVTSFILLWGLIPVAYTYAILALAAMPWIVVTIARKSRGLLRIDTRRNEIRPNAGLAFLIPGMILLLHAVNDFNVIVSFRVAWITMGIAALLCYSAVAADGSLRGKAGTILVLYAFSLAYGYGLAVESNSILDRSPGTLYSVRVRDKRIVRGKSTSYELELEPWGPRTAPNRLRVNRYTYDPIERGNVVEIVLRPGALGVPWYFMRAGERGDASRTGWRPGLPPP